MRSSILLKKFLIRTTKYAQTNPPPHNKNVLGQNFSFVVAQGGATFSGKFRSFNKNVHFNKKVL